MTQQCQSGASVTGQSAAGEGVTIDAAKNGPTVMGVAGGRKQRSRRQPSSRPLMGQRENPLPRREDDAPVFRFSNGSRTRNGCPVNHSPRHINSAAGQTTPLAGEAGDASPSPSRPRQKRCITSFDSVSFSSSSFSLLQQGPGKGIPRKGSFSAKETGPEPPTDQRFEGWPLGGVQQPPQSARAPRPLLVRGSRAGPSEGFNGRLRPLGLHAHY
jgi:hypothetical protein